MGQHFKLEIQEFNNNNDLFNILEIKAEQVIGKDYQELVKFLKEQYRKLILVNHPDKGGIHDRFLRIQGAYEELGKYIEPLKSGDPCVKIRVDTESDGRLTAHEFHYRKKLFDALDIGEEESVRKNFMELIYILKRKISSLEKDLQHKDSLIRDINWWAGFSLLGDDEVKKLRNELDEHLMKPNMQLFNYISPLRKGGSLIREDKQALTQKFINRRDGLLSSVFKTKVYTLSTMFFKNFLFV